MEPITPETPLTPFEQRFVTEFLRTGNKKLAVKAAGIPEDKSKSYDSEYRKYSDMALKLMKQPNIKAEIDRAMNELKNETVATAQEVMGYFTSVMRGEVKDQFGLEASLADRTRAAQELAKRTVDIENRDAGEADQLVAIQLDWSRN